MFFSNVNMKTTYVQNVQITVFTDLWQLHIQPTVLNYFIVHECPANFTVYHC